MHRLTDTVTEYAAILCAPSRHSHNDT